MRDGHRGEHDPRPTEVPSALGRLHAARVRLVRRPVRDRPAMCTVLAGLAATLLLMAGSLAGTTALGVGGGRAGAATTSGAETPNVYNSGAIVDFGDAQNLDTI